MTIEAAPQPGNFTAAFSITISGIRTVNVGELSNVVKHAEWLLEGVEAGQSFRLPQRTMMGEPDAQDFIPLASLTPEAITAWIEAAEAERMAGIKSYIQNELNKMIADAAMQSSPLPWAPSPVSGEN
jgi:siderophore synthetase component